MLEERNSQASILRFGVFEVDLATGELRKRGVRIKLQEQPFRILVLLLERAGEVITRDTIRKALWPQETFVEFEQSINAAVAKLRVALADSADNPRFIETVARHGYRFVAPVSPDTGSIPAVAFSTESNAATSEGTHIARRQIGAGWVLPACIAALLIAGTGVSWHIWYSGKHTPEPLIAAKPLTSYSGFQLSPSFSPEGTRVAFSWYEPGKLSPGIYVKLVGPDNPIRLAASSHGDFSPAWSPDGRTIAFLRARTLRETAVVTILAVGGPDKEISAVKFGVWQSVDHSISALAPFLAWSADGKWLLATECDPLASCAIIRLPLDGGEARPLTFPPKGHDDGTIAVSPDGKTLAFTRTAAMLTRDIYTVALSDDVLPAGKPKQLTFDAKEIHGLAWTPDGQRLVFSSTRGGRLELWQMPAKAFGKPVRITAAGEEPTFVALSREGHNLVYSHRYRDSNIWRMAISGPRAGQAANFISSTRIDAEPRYSPDGKHIAFESNRTGSEEIWVSRDDASDPVQLTSFGAWAGSPRWSPDSARIAFDCNVAGNWHIYVTRSQGGKPFRLTTSDKDEMRPSWSQDGKWIYYSSTRTGRAQIFKIPSNGGTETQVTRNGGFLAFESADGEDLYYSTLNGELAKTPVAGGRETIILKSIYWLDFAPGRRGLYFIDGSPGSTTLRLLGARTLSARSIAAVPAPLGLGGEMAISPDERWMLYERIDRVGSELMLIENFR